MRAARARLLVPFRYPGFGFYWGNTLLTSTGLWMEMVAQGWLIVELTDSPFMLGLVAGSQGLATVVVGAVGGVVADLVERRRLLMLVQGCRALIALVMAVLVGTEVVQIWHVALLALASGAANAVQAPTRHTLVYDLIGREHLAQAVAMNMTASNVMRIMGPAAGGLLVGYFGIAGCYGVVAACWLLGSATIGFIRVKALPTPKADRSVWHNLVEGLRYVRTQRLILLLLGTEVVADTFAFSHRFLVPFFARDILGVGAIGLGLLLSASGLGALLGAATIGAVSTERNRGQLLVACLFGFGVFLLLFSFSRWFPLSFLLLMGAGGMGTAFDSLMATILQMLIPDEFRGRVMGLYVLTWGMSPVGGFQSGTVAGLFGVPLAVGFGGLVAACVAVLLARLAPDLIEAGRASPPAATPGRGAIGP
ncbi:MAG: MFS transporter [Chloroflexi bacterium]|nr:MFS transporter [Chloroflexota bacterium]